MVPPVESRNQKRIWRDRFASPRLPVCSARLSACLGGCWVAVTTAFGQAGTGPDLAGHRLAGINECGQHRAEFVFARIGTLQSGHMERFWYRPAWTRLPYVACRQQPARVGVADVMRVPPEPGRRREGAQV
ncbi:hypothetical protein SKAU_G00302030 [Synaphobranchus kaupii]|uniref:Uncharacterized protein n=1 Tax=Synaphobranchus kaupii TaxID=118154 RepID=A0A9Q1EVX3_SYNKA|nr:hypothetical protein SKAU_G00302030 [Synaphobranchus kaupii]